MSFILLVWWTLYHGFLLRRNILQDIFIATGSFRVNLKLDKGTQRFWEMPTTIFSYFLFDKPFLIAIKVNFFWTSERSLRCQLKNEFVELNELISISQKPNHTYLKHSKHKIYVQFVFLQGPG